MTTLTVTIPDEKDLSVLQEILDRFGLNYSVDNFIPHQFSKTEINGFRNSKEDFLQGKTTARDWKEIDEELNSAYS